MSSLSRARIIVVGAGVLGLATAAFVARRGARVQIIDPDGGLGSASAAAAGMIAPAMEAALDDPAPGRAALYRDAAVLWPEFARRHGLDLVIDGADWLGPRAPIQERLASLGFPSEERGDALFVPGEGRLDAREALRRFAAEAGAEHGKFLHEQVLGVEPGPVVVTTEARHEADAVVLAAGWAAGGLALPEGLRLAHITPIKGQIIRLSGPSAQTVARVTRGPMAYIVPTADGVLVGATMQAGVTDTEVDAEVSATLHRAAADLVPGLASADIAGAWSGVRGGTADGLPLAGSTAVAGLFAALAPRRNGWMLAPLVGEIVAAAVAGDAPPPHAAAFRPDRFDPA